MSETKQPSAHAMRMAELLLHIPSRPFDEYILRSAADLIDHDPGMIALERCREALEEFVNDHINARWDESAHRERVCNCELCIEARAALAEAKKGGT